MNFGDDFQLRSAIQFRIDDSASIYASWLSSPQELVHAE